MSVKIIVDRAGFDDFYGVFNTDKILDKEEIEKLFDKPSYQKMVELFGADVKFTEKAEFGKEVDFTKKEPWVALFYEAYKLYLNGSQMGEDADPVERNIINAVLWALNNLDKLNENVDELIKIINRAQFVEKALNYLPTIEADVHLKIGLYIFMNNACVEDDEMLLDVSFASKLDENELNDLLAHEMHHYLKQQIKGIYKSPKEGYKDITNSLFMLENEGTADMCSFEGLSSVYELLGFAEKGVMKDVLTNSTAYLKQFSNMLKNKLISNDDSINLTNFLLTNQIMHPLGYTMASKIESVLGIEELRNCVGRPLEFLLKYQEAINKTSGEKIFGSETIAKLKEIYE